VSSLAKALKIQWLNPGVEMRKFAYAGAAIQQSSNLFYLKMLTLCGKCELVGESTSPGLIMVSLSNPLVVLISPPIFLFLVEKVQVRSVRCPRRADASGFAARV